MAVREGLLALISDGPSYGYQLKVSFEEATGGIWPLNVGQVYTTLDRLVRDGFAQVDGQGDTPSQKLYTITAAGREELGAWWQTIPAEEPPPRDELMLKVLMAIDRGRDHALDVITRHRTVLTSMLQQHRRRRRADVDVVGVAAALVTDALVVRAEADLRWLDLCEARLADAPTTPRSSDPSRLQESP